MARNGRAISDGASYLELVEFFRLSEEKAIEIIEDVKSAVRKWREIATKYGIPRAEQELKALAFRQVYR